MVRLANEMYLLGPNPTTFRLNYNCWNDVTSNYSSAIITSCYRVPVRTSCRNSHHRRMQEAHIQHTLGIYNEDLRELPVCRHLHTAGFCIKKQISEPDSLEQPSVSTYSNQDEPP